MRGDSPRPGLETSIRVMFEPEPGAVVGRGLLGVAHPPFDVIEVQEFPLLGFGTLKI